MRKVISSTVFGATVLVVLVVIVLTWRPWDDGAQGRITASGLVPVLTLVLGQLGAWVVTSTSSEQAIAVRNAELSHDANQNALRAAREQATAEVERKRQEKLAIRLRFVEAISATSALAPALANAAKLVGPAVPTSEFARARVAVLTVAAYLDPEDLTDEGLHHLSRSLLNEMQGLTGAISKDTFKTAANAVIYEIGEFEHAVSTSVYLL